VNLCEACGEDFGSITAFDNHRVGTHAYTFSMHDPGRLDGRRCLSVIEVKALGWNKDGNGRWRTPPKAVSEDGGMSSERLGEAA
jgi:hypothetical protein